MSDYVHVLTFVAVVTSINAAKTAVVMYSNESCSTPTMIYFGDIDRECGNSSCLGGMSTTCTSDWNAYSKSIFGNSTYTLKVCYDNQEGNSDDVACATEAGDMEGNAMKINECVETFDGSISASIATNGSLVYARYREYDCTEFSDYELVPAEKLTGRSCYENCRYYLSPSGTTSNNSAARGFAILAALVTGALLVVF